MQSVSEIWEIEIRAFAFWAPQVLAYSGMSAKEVIKVLAYPLVIWREAPRSIEKIKKTANCPSLKSLKAERPVASAKD